MNGAPEDNEDSLLGHAKYFMGKGFEVSARVVVFGTLGSELDGFSEGAEESRQSVFNKISNAFDKDMATFCSEGLHFEKVDEDTLLKALEAWSESRIELRAYPPIMIDHLASVVRRLSLNRGCMSATQVEKSVRTLGIKLAAITGAVRQYGNTIHPLSGLFSRESGEDIAEEYRLGINARPEHIASNLDIRRPHWLSKIEDGYASDRLVIVRGASGQGKSTICYRYILESGSADNSFLIEGMESIEDARDICSFIVALSETRAETTHYVYVDGARGEAWKWLAQQIYERSGPNVRMLVSIREEDYSSANLSTKSFRSSEVVLSLSESEARTIYECYRHERYRQSKYLSFEDAWKIFGESGPLMEFTHMLSTDSTLPEMLATQAERIIQEHEDSWVYALYLASLIGAEGLTCSLPALKEVTGCVNMMSFVKSVDREHLLRTSGKKSIGAMHPWRSRVLASILEPHCIYFSLDDIAKSLVSCAESSCGTLLVNLHMKHGWRMTDAQSLVEAAGTSWGKLSELIKYALWSDARRVYDDTEELRRKTSKNYLSSWYLFALAGGVTKTYKNDNAKIFLESASDDRFRAIWLRLYDEAAKCKVDYTVTKAVLREINLDDMQCPSNPLDLTSAGFCLTQYHSCKIVDERVTKAAQRIWDLFSPDDQPLSSSLDFALGVQLCGAKLSRESREQLAKTINGRHSVLTTVICKRQK